MMNRNDVYWILKSCLNNYKVVVNGRPYNKFYVPRDWEHSYLVTDGIVITDFNEIYLCSDEIVVRGKYEALEVNIKYKHMTSLEVGGE